MLHALLALRSAAPIVHREEEQAISLVPKHLLMLQALREVLMDSSVDLLSYRLIQFVRMASAEQADLKGKGQWLPTTTNQASEACTSKAANQKSIDSAFSLTL